MLENRIIYSIFVAYYLSSEYLVIGSSITPFFFHFYSKVEEEVNLTHFAYSGWGDAPQRPRSPNPGQGSPEVPKATTGLLDLVEHALAHKVEASLPGPIAVHCRCVYY